MRRQRRRVGIVVLLAGAALAPTGRAAAEDYGPDLEAYLALIERYQAGDVEGPVRVVGTWGPVWIDAAVGRLLEALEKIPESSHGRPADEKAAKGGKAYDVRVAQDNVRVAQGAFLLHTQTALAGHELGLRPTDHDAHVEAAWRFLRWFRDRYFDDPSSWPPEASGLKPRDFSLALASGELLTGHQRVALDLATESLRRESPDAELRLVAGCAAEMEALIRRQAKGEWPDRPLRDAERRFGEALDDDPALLEARLRLGWVLVRRGWAEKGRPYLETVAETPGDDGRRALAWLFLGRAHEKRKDAPAAVEAYRRAIEIAPQFQAAHIALAHALERGAGDEAARAILVPYFLERSRSWVREDPWNAYPFGPPEMRLRPFEALRERLCSR